jgi:hypothetical protein
MISSKEFMNLVENLPAIDQKRELDDSELEIVAGAFTDCVFDDSSYLDQPFNLAQNEVSG